MTNKYTVSTAGFPYDKKEIYAQSPLDAARIFFSNHKFKDSIVVKWGFWDSKIIHVEDLQKAFPVLNENGLTYRPEKEDAEDTELRCKDMTFFQKVLNNYFFQRKRF